MEPLAYKLPAFLLKNLNYLSFILKYYGYADEDMFLCLNLCQKTRKIWNENIKSLAQVILTHNKRVVTQYGANSQEKTLLWMGKADQLLRMDLYSLVHLEVEIAELEGLRGMMYLMENMSIHCKHQFTKIAIKVDGLDSRTLNRFFKLYFELNFDEKVIELGDLRKELPFTETIIRRWLPEGQLEYFERGFYSPEHNMFLSKKAKTMHIDTLIEVAGADEMDKPRIPDFRYLIVGEEENAPDNTRIWSLINTDYCKGIQVDVGSKMIGYYWNLHPEHKDQFGRAEACAKYFKNIEEIYSHKSGSTRAFLSSNFCRDPKTYPNLSKVPNIRFEEKGFDSEIGLEFSTDNAEFFIKHEGSQSFKLFTCSKLTIKLSNGQYTISNKRKTISVLNSIYYFHAEGLKFSEKEYKPEDYSEFMTYADFDSHYQKLVILNFINPGFKRDGNTKICSYISEYRPTYKLKTILIPPKRKVKGVFRTGPRISYRPTITSLKNIDMSSAIKIEVKRRNDYHLPPTFPITRRFVTFGDTPFGRKRDEEMNRIRKDNGDQGLAELLDLIKEGNLVEFTSESLIGPHPDLSVSRSTQQVLENLIEICKYTICLRKIELYFSHSRDLHSVLKAFMRNYVTKEIKFYCLQSISEETEELVKEIKKDKFGLKIRIISLESGVYPN